MTAVAITPRSFRDLGEEHLEPLRARRVDVRFPQHSRVLDEAEMVELVGGCEGVIVGIDPVTEPVLAAGPLRVVVKYGSGLDNVDLGAAERMGVEVMATPGANAPSVAELTLGLLIAVARHIGFHDRAIHSGGWERKLGVELRGKRLGIVGYGAIGRDVARLARGLGMEVVAHDPFLSSADVELVPLDELLASSDAVSLHVPLGDETRGLIGNRELERMRPGAFLVNTARGGIVDETALAEALRSGHLGGAAIDAFASEPPENSPLLGLQNVVASPHAGAATAEAARRTSKAAVELLIRHL